MRGMAFGEGGGARRPGAGGTMRGRGHGAGRHSAGVIVHDGEGKVLLGLHRDGWTSFAGKGEGGETPRETALREFAEETLFVLGDRLHVDAAPAVTSLTPSGRAFYMFSARTPHDTSLEEDFERVRQSRRYASTEGCDETCALRWFDADELSRVRVRPSFRADLDRILATVLPSASQPDAVLLPST